ncbi:nuclear transport factor 2 family protein, partial [Pseudonocardia sp. KRD-184]
MSATDPRLAAEIAGRVHALWYDIDHHAGRDATAFFTPDARLTFDRRTMTGHTQIRAAYDEIATDAERISRHLSGNLHVVGNDEEVTATSVVQYYSAPGPPPAVVSGPVMVGDVRDRWCRIDGTWLLAERSVIFLF